MLSMSFQSQINATWKPTTTKLPSQNPLLKPSIFLKPQTSCWRISHYPRQVKVKLSSPSPAVDSIVDHELAAGDFDSDIQKEKLGVVVKPNEKPRLLLKFIWMQKDIGIALDRKIPGHGTIPLSPYYFWPRKDAWEELKVLLESKPWISQMERINLLNQATDIINLWQTSGGNL